jgi:Lon protease-like protein
MAAARDRIPIFPLENVVLFPEVEVPLHVFEPRYRQMVRAARDGDRRIGMVAVQPDPAAGMMGDPPVFEVGCAGVLTAVQELPEGRFDITLRGTRRFRIHREPPRPRGQLYRIVEVEWLDDPVSSADAPRTRELRARVSARLRDLARRSTAPGGADEVGAQLGALPDVAFVNQLCQLLPFGPREKQGLLEIAAIPERLAALAGLLEFRLAELAAGHPPGPSTVH